MNSFRILFAIIIVTVLSSCESKTFLRSKKKLDKDLQGYWCPIQGTSSYCTVAFNNNILWHFDNGEISIIKVNDNGDEVPVDKGHYSIDTKIDSDFLTVSDLNSAEYLTYGFNVKWDIIDLQKNNLNLSGTPKNNGKIQIEFSKIEH